MLFMTTQELFFFRCLETVEMKEMATARKPLYIKLLTLIAGIRYKLI